MDHYSDIVGTSLGCGPLRRTNAGRMSEIHMVNAEQSRQPCSRFVESARTLLSL